ncbi:MAG: NUDIX domain-containing protein [Chloroflexota bacterium]
MKKLIKTDSNIPWLHKPGEGRLYITDELPNHETWGTAFGFTFQADKLLMTRLHDRDWDIPGGMIETSESPEEAAIREVWEETYAEVEIIELIGIQEVELFGPKPDGYRWSYPLNTQIYFLCRLVKLAPFEANAESFERGFIAPDEARQLPTMRNHDGIYEEALRRI